MTKTKVLITHSASLSTALAAAKESGISQDRIVILDSQPDGPKSYPNVETLVRDGLSSGPSFTERRLAPGEAKTKLALLSFSSGTTGRPKAVAIPHHSVIANTIQMAVHGKANEDYTSWEDRRYRPGDAVYTGTSRLPDPKRARLITSESQYFPSIVRYIIFLTLKVAL